MQRRTKGHKHTGNKCTRCHGIGYLPEWAHVNGGRCHACLGLGYVTTEARTASKNRARAAQRWQADMRAARAYYEAVQEHIKQQDI